MQSADPGEVTVKDCFDFLRGDFLAGSRRQEDKYSQGGTRCRGKFIPSEIRKSICIFSEPLDQVTGTVLGRKVLKSLEVAIKGGQE